MTPEIEALCARLEAVESDPIGAGLSNNRYRNPDGPEAAAKLREMAGALTAIEKMRDGYKSQMKFCDIEALGYFRELVRRIEVALAGGSHG